MKRFVLIALSISLLWMSACTARPTQVSGDVWSYRLLPEELPAGWTIASQDIYTAADLSAVASVTPTAPISGTSGLTDAQQLYSASYRPPENSQYANFTLDIIRYPTSAEAQQGLSHEGLAEEEWEQVPHTTLGDESRVWHFRNPAEATNQNLYRVDFRYLNAVGSVSMLGSASALPNADEALGYARQVLAKMQAAPQPAALEKLQSAQLPDTRTLMLTPAQIQTATGGNAEWSLNNLLLPGWVGNEDFPNAEARDMLNRLGRITGYQMWLIKPPAEGQAAIDPAVGLFQQVSVYQQAASTAQGLQAMIGIPNVSESQAAPAIGEGARMWSTLIPQDPSNKQGALVATSEISFRVGHYVASVQLQSQPIDDPSTFTVLQQNHDLAIAVAQALAQNLSGGQ